MTRGGIGFLVIELNMSTRTIVHCNINNHKNIILSESGCGETSERGPGWRSGGDWERSAV
jgi:hypothetical protein